MIFSIGGLAGTCVRHEMAATWTSSMATGGETRQELWGTQTHTAMGRTEWGEYSAQRKIGAEVRPVTHLAHMAWYASKVTYVFHPLDCA